MGKLLLFTKMNFGVAANQGIKKKVFSQAKAFERSGLETDTFFLEGDKFIIRGKDIEQVFQPSGKFSYLSYLYGGFLNDIAVTDYSYIYIRHFLINPLFIRLLAKIKRQHPAIKIVMEIPTYPYRFEFEQMPLVSRLALWLDQQTFPSLKNYIDRIVTFSSQQTIAEIPTIQTDNGIDVEQFGLLPKAAFDGENLHLLALANMQRWHGFDRLLHGLAAYIKQSPRVTIHLHLVGKGDEEEKLKTLATDLSLQPFVTFYGFQTGKDLEAIFEKTHVGIGSLGMHRINVADGQTSTLKSREYAARGLPFVMAYQDRGFPADFPYFLILPADETPIDLNLIVAFYTNLQENHPNFNTALNAYAWQHLTWEAKLAPVVQYFKHEQP